MDAIVLNGLLLSRMEANLTSGALGSVFVLGGVGAIAMADAGLWRDR